MGRAKGRSRLACRRMKNTNSDKWREGRLHCRTKGWRIGHLTAPLHRVREPRRWLDMEKLTGISLWTDGQKSVCARRHAQLRHRLLRKKRPDIAFAEYAARKIFIVAWYHTPNLQQCYESWYFHLLQLSQGVRQRCPRYCSVNVATLNATAPSPAKEQVTKRARWPWSLCCRKQQMAISNGLRRMVMELSRKVSGGCKFFKPI